MDPLKMTPMVAPANLGKPLDDLLTRHWAEFTGPYVKFSPRAVLRELARYANPKTGECFVTLETLADTLAMTTRTIMTAIETLERAGLITVTRKKNHCNRYRLVGIDNQWQPAERLTPGQLPLDDFRLQTEKNLRDELANLKRQYVSLTNGELPETTFFSPEEKKKESSSEKFVNQILPSSSVTPVTPSLGEKNVEKNGHDLDTRPIFTDTPPAEWEPEYVTWAVTVRCPKWALEWGNVDKAPDYFKDKWPTFIAQFKTHREKEDKLTAKPAPAKAYTSPYDSRDYPVCDQCGQQDAPSRMRNGKCARCRAPQPAGVWE